MNTGEERTTRWTYRGIAVLVVLALALFVVTTYSVIQTANDRAAAADRAERTTAELEMLAQRLDRQAAALDRQTTALEQQAAALEEQAAALESRAAQADRSRAKFREAAREILERLGSDLDTFEAETSTQPSHGHTAERDTTSEPEPAAEPRPTAEPEPTADEMSEPAPGCVKSGGRPSRCDGG